MAHVLRAGPQLAGPLGPVALSGGVLLLWAAPIARGGNRQLALIALELIALAVLLALWFRFLFDHEAPLAGTARTPWLVPLLMSPLLLALVQLMPLPAQWWAALPGHELYTQSLQAAGVAADRWRPLTVSADATTASLLAALPWVAAFLLGYFCSLGQLRTLMRAVAIMAFVQVALGLLQVSGGEFSPFYFGVLTYGAPIGSFANRNHFANYLAMALAAYVWLAYENLHARKRRSGGTRVRQGSFTERHAIAVWVAGGLVLVLGILMTRSRGAALFGLPMAGLALAVGTLRLAGWTRGWRFAGVVVAALVLGAAALIGFDQVVSRISAHELATSAGYRAELTRTGLEGAWAYWPWGSGWGTYDLAYQRFQPPALPIYSNHVHMDYVEMLFEGGVFFVAIAAGFLWLGARRAWLLSRMALRDRALDDDAMAAALCGLGLLGLLLHSLVEFNLRIPANAMLGALLAGVYLRPVSLKPRFHDRSAQPYPSRRRRRLNWSGDVAGDGANSAR